MIRKFFLLIIIFSLFNLSSGCTKITQDNLASALEKKYEKVNNYSCKMVIIFEKSGNLHEMEQYFEKPQFYKLISNTGQWEVVFDGKDLEYKLNNIYEKKVIEDIGPINAGMGLLFLDNYVKKIIEANQSFDFSIRVKNEKEYLVITIKDDKNDSIINGFTIWICRKKLLPNYVDVKDRKGNQYFHIEYKDIIIN